MVGKSRRCEVCGVRESVVGGFFASFPKDEVRCKIWVKQVGNEDLVFVPIEKLFEERNVCANHFESRDFGKTGKRLKKRAYPKLHLSAPPLSDQQMIGFPQHVASKQNLVPAPPEETQTLSGIDEVPADDFVTYEVPAPDHASPVPEVEDTAENNVFSWQKPELIEADDPDDPPERSPPPPADPTLALTCDSDPGLATQDQAVPALPAPAEKDVENRCKDCAEANEGFWFWCVECLCGALCGACAGRPPHHAHHVLRTPMHADRTQTQAVLMVIRQQLQNENLLSQHETLDDDGLKVEVKEEPPEPPPEPEPPAEPDPLACEPHENQCIAEQIVDNPQPLKLPQLPVAQAYKENVPLGTKLAKVSPVPVKRKFVFHLEKIVNTQQVKGLQTKFPACKENLVTLPIKAREYQVPKSVLKPLTSSRSQTAGNFTAITRPNQASTQAPTSTKVTSDPKPSETVIIDLDGDETVEYLEEGLDSDIEMVEEVLDDNETSEDDNRVTNEDDALDDRETNEDGLGHRVTNEDDDGWDDRDDDVLDEDYLVDEDDLSEDDSDEDTIANLARKGVKRKTYLDKRNSGQTILPLDSIIREDDRMEDDLSDEDPIVNIAGRGVKRKEDEEETSPAPPHGSMAQELPSKAVVQVRAVSSLEIRNWTADRKRHRKY